MSSQIIFIDKELKKFLFYAAEKKFGKKRVHDTALVLLQNHKQEFKKQGIDVASDVLDFVFFDQDLVKIGVVKRSDIKSFKKIGTGK